jgi:translation initiation factor IF-3
MSKSITVPAFGHARELKIHLTKTQAAEERLHEAQVVNPGTYSELEYTFNESYRELRKNVSSIQYEIANIQKTIDERKADLILDVIPEMLKDKPKSQNNADFRGAVFARDDDYQKALDHLNKLRAMESHFEGKIKVMERTCMYMRKQMDLIIRAGYTPPVRNTGARND